jgi:putative endopeptidase
MPSYRQFFQPECSRHEYVQRQYAGPGRFRASRFAAGVLAVLLGGALMLMSRAPTAAGERTERATPGAAYGRWGFDISGIDRAVRPGDSFYDYANGAADARAVIPADQPSIGTFGDLKEKARNAMISIIAKADRAGASPDNDTGKIAALYHAFTDEDRRERLDLSPVAGELADIRNAATRTDVAILMGRSERHFGKTLFVMSVREDEKDPGRHALYVGQSGLGLPDRDYYLRAAFADKKAAYRDYIARLLTMAGWPDAGQRADEVLTFETRIAEASWSRAESRDRDRTYNPLTPAELDALAPGFPWAAWLDAAGVGHVRVVVVRQKTAFPRLAQIFADTPMVTLQAWQAFRVVDEAAPYLSARFVNAEFDFRGRTLSGETENRAPLYRAVQFVNDVLGDAVGREYVARNFSPDSRSKLEGLVGQLKQAMRNRIRNLSWMTPATKERALEKLDQLRVKIGYPDKWRDYAALAIDPSDLAGNIRRAASFRWDLAVAKLDKAVDPLEWSMTPQTVNAEYWSTRNEIVFPAAILQPPFFDPNADMAINYGAIGGVIGHEITHAFDDQGRKFDGHGMLVDWWQPADAARFQAEAAKLGAQYDAYAVAPGVNVKGALTMGENIADLGGVLLALDAYSASLQGAPAPVLDGATGVQRVFLGWAQIWRSKHRPESLMKIVASDPHAPQRFRVDGPLRNVDAWYEAFGVKPGNRLYLRPEERVRIW